MIKIELSEREIKSLRQKIAHSMVNIRRRTPFINPSPFTAKGSEIWEGRLDDQPVERVIIYLRSCGCSWVVDTKANKPRIKAGCLDCEHSLAGTTFGTPIAAAAYISQFESEFDKFDFSKYPIFSLYNEGSFFNKAELPLTARREILKRIAETPGIKSLILESLPEFVDEETLDDTRNILGDKNVEIGIGLESADPLVRSLCVNKSFNLKKFEETAQLINKYFSLLSYVLIKPSFLTELESLHDAIDTAKYAFDVGSKIVSLEPLSIGEYAMSGALSRVGLYRPPYLWTVLEIAKVAVTLGETRIGGFQFAPQYDVYAHNCDVCTMNVKDAIRRYNSTYDFTVFDNLDCDCKRQWENLLAEEPIPLPERIIHHIQKINSN
jgi:hypothetical protein